jgi:ornithine decarboxylase
MVGVGVLTNLFLTQKPEDTFYVYELGILERAYKEWTRVFPTIRPFYAVKCNPDPRIVNVLATLGSSFDCASPAEIDLVLGMGVEQERIIYANPCKRRQEIAHAKNLNIKLTTFDSVCELEKLAEDQWGQVVLRIRADDPEARCNLGIKYGAEKNEWAGLMARCQSLGLELVGVSFHVGSMAKNPVAFKNGILLAMEAIELSKEYGFDPRLVDIGGGFSSTNVFDLGPVPEQINETIANLDPKIKFIAEPGRYFVEHMATLVTPVMGVKGTGVTVSESLYGAFNCVLFDHAEPVPGFFIDQFGNKIEGPQVPRTLFGSTCDGGDIISKQISLPESLKEGDWIVWPRMGAYTSAATTRFNGIPFNERLVLDDIVP